jgi:acetylornithine deacetylase
MQSRGLKADNNLAWAEQVAAAARAAGVDSKLVGVPFGTNAASIAAAGIPTVVFGPGSIAQAHTADEWIAIDQLDRAVDVLQHIALSPIAR